MSGPTLPHYLPSQAVAVTFADGLFNGFYLVTVGFANRWLFFTDEGWHFRKQIHWPLAIITNLTWVLMMVGLGLNVHTPVAMADFVEEGHRPEDFSSPGWDSIVKVCSSINQLESRDELTWIAL
jgi:hypothetical protein